MAKTILPSCDKFLNSMTVMMMIKQYIIDYHVSCQSNSLSGRVI